MTTIDFPTIASSFSSASNGMLAAVLDQSADCIKVIGPNGSLDFMNRNGRCALGIDDFNLVAGMNWWDMWPAESQHLVRNAITAARDHGSARFEGFCPTAKGEPRASVAFVGLTTLWVNTGTLCNITCANCYIESSPRNDRLVYISALSSLSGWTRRWPSAPRCAR